MSFESLNLAKGENMNLSQASSTLTLLGVGAGWDMKGSKAIDLDLGIMPYGEDGKVISSEVCYYGRLSSLGGALKHSGDNRTGAGDGDDETIKINLPDVPANVKGLAIIVFSFSGENFGQVANAFVRAYDAVTSEQFAKYDMTEDHSGERNIELGRVYRHNGEWKFKAIGVGSPENQLGKIAQAFQA